MDGEASTSSTSPTFQRPTLRNLDLRALQPEDQAPSETQLRRQKYLYFEKHCSEVSPGLFLSGDYVAKNRETLRQAGVTHVLNCVGFICKEYFKDELTYKTLYLQDTPAEDISCVLYDCLDYIESALSSGGRILVHCSQGVSRSATLVIAYMMWRSGKPYDEVFAAVKAIRGVANPNIGFTCQLLQWQKRAATARSRLRLYRIAPHCVHAPTYLVPKLITPPKQYPNNTHRDLDPRGAFVLQTPGGPTYVWRGEHCPETFAEAAHRAAEQLRKFEGAGPVVEVRQGEEPSSLLTLLDPAPLDAEAARLNARRSSITGEIELLSAREHAPSGPQAHQAVASAPGPGGDMDVDAAPSSSSGGGSSWGGAGGAPSEAGSASGSQPMDLSTPRPRPEAAAEPGGAAALLEEVACVRTSDAGVFHWTPKEVDEYTDDYMMYHHSQPGKAAASGGAYEGTMRASYDTAGSSITTTGLIAPAGPQADCLLMGQAVRPDSPAAKEGHRKKYRRADSERPKHAGWTTAISDGYGTELARTHNVCSLHESVDEDVMGLPPTSR